MININGAEKLARMQRRIINLQVRNEPKFKKAVNPILRKQWREAISSVENGNTNINQDVLRYQNEMLRSYIDQYRRLGEVFFNFVSIFVKKEKRTSYYEMKDMEGIFSQTFEHFVQAEALRKVTTIIDPNTIKALKTIIDRGLRDGMSYGEIAKEMRALEPRLNRFRSNRIAATEVHSVFGEAADQAIEASGLPIEEKEWVAFIDERTRVEHASVGGTRIPKDDLFIVGTDRMRFPGDVTASPENLILCRCVLMYFTVGN